MELSGDFEQALREALSRAEFEAVEDLWIRAIEAADEGPRPDARSFIEAADSLLQAGEKERAEVLLDLTLPVYEKQGDPKEHLELFRTRCLAVPENRKVRRQFGSHFRKLYGPASVEVVYLELSGVEDAPDGAQAFRDLDRWLRFREGGYVYHPAGWGVGKILSIDAILRLAEVDLEQRPKHRMDLRAMGSVLEPLDVRHFLALKHEGGEVLRRWADEDPVALIDCVLQSFGNPRALREIKSRLTPEPIPTPEWTRWWTRTKKALRENGFFRVADRAPFSVEKLEAAVSYEDHLEAAFQSGDWKARRKVARKVLREKNHRQTRLPETVVRELGRVAEGEPGPRSVEAAFLLERFGSVTAGDSCSLSGVLRALPDPVGAILQVEGAEEQVAAVSLLPRILGDGWAEAALRLLETGGVAVQDTVRKTLGDGSLEERARARIEEASNWPRGAPGLFLWTVQRFLEEGPVDILKPLARVSSADLFGKVLEILDHLGIRLEREGSDRLRDLVVQARNLLSVKSKSSNLFPRAIEGLEVDTGRSLYERILRSRGFSDSLRAELLDLFSRTHPEVATPRRAASWEGREIYVTEMGLKRRREELRKLMEEKLPENFEDIGRAAAFGDLSENAEFTAALEQQGLLTKRAEEIRQELDRARLITPDMLREGEVTLGCQVTLLNLGSGQTTIYRILGPWDGDPEEGVLSYKSPLARAFLGSRVGQEVKAQLPGGAETFRVLEIAPGNLDG